VIAYFATYDPTDEAARMPPDLALMRPLAGEALRAAPRDDARLLLRTLLRQCVEQVGHITVLAAEEHVEAEQRYRRAVGYESLSVRLEPRRTSD
ncbi:MAG TPA: hypothetical protein PKE47_02510, partial [Verrucomicrobiota bacterium]|nr:hypothetical protein [Verrucomicrobiota bacterium]